MNLWVEFMTKVNVDPLWSLGFYGLLGIGAAIPMKMASRLLASPRTPSLFNTDRSPAIVTFIGLATVWFTSRLVPLIDENSLMIAIGLTGMASSIEKHITKPASDAMGVKSVPAEPPAEDPKP